MTLPSSPYFTLQTLAQGVYAAVSIAGAGSMSNSGIVDLGDRALIFDTMFTPQAASDLRAAAERLTGHRDFIVVNSHFHADHTVGNMVFDDMPILATTRTRALISARTGALVSQVTADPDGPIREEEAEIARIADSTERKRRGLELGDMRVLAASASTLRLRLPNMLFADRQELGGPARAVEVLTYGGGHTDSDAFLYLPQERMLFTGDLVVIRTHPWMGHGHPDAWPGILDRMEALDFTTLVPGHGPVGEKGDIAAMRGYLADIQRFAADLRARGVSPDEAAKLPFPPQYAEWAGSAEGNLRFLLGGMVG